MSAGEVIGEVIGALTAMTGLSWVVSAVTVRASRAKILAEAGKTRADAAEVIKKSALSMVADMEEDAKGARVEAREARDEARAARTAATQADNAATRAELKVNQLSRQLDDAIEMGKAALAELRILKTAILDPQATISGLRDLVTRSSRNGVP